MVKSSSIIGTAIALFVLAFTLPMALDFYVTNITAVTGLPDAVVFMLTTLVPIFVALGLMIGFIPYNLFRRNKNAYQVSQTPIAPIKSFKLDLAGIDT